MEPTQTRQLVEDFLNGIGAEILPITHDTAVAAVEAFSRFGKGRHPAKLSFGDCFSYASARQAGMPLLYVGEDFAKTDIG